MELFNFIISIIQNPIFIHGLLLTLVYLTTMFLIIEIKKDPSIGNFTWGGMVMLIALYTFFTTSFYGSRQILATMLILIWGLRLALYAYMRYHKGADPRFVAWQQQKGFVAHIFDFGWIFILNGFMGSVMSVIIITINTQMSGPLNWLDAVALCWWIIGFCFESISDFQLFIFKEDPMNYNRILTTGLWRYSRHPNYFGEIVMWWSMYLIALSVPYGYLTIVTPSAITISLLFVTGIPWLEKAMANNPDYQEYKKRTSTLIPMPPKER